MKLLIKAFSLLIMVLSMVSCQQSNKSENTETGDEEQATEEVSTPSVINPNLASEEELNGLGISAELVGQIVENRPFLKMNDLDALIGNAMDAAAKEALYGKMFVPFNLNTTPEDDFKMIPGVGDRMAHEFEEYRPYLKLEQFRREIGKYVDEDEVARYEHYVFVPVELNTASEEDIKALPGVGDRMAHEFEEYRPYKSMEQFRKEIGKYVDDKELSRLERFVYLKGN